MRRSRAQGVRVPAVRREVHNALDCLGLPRTALDTDTLLFGVFRTTTDGARLPEMPPECLVQVPEYLGQWGTPAAQRAPRCGGGGVNLSPVRHTIAENTKFSQPLRYRVAE